MSGLGVMFGDRLFSDNVVGFGDRSKQDRGVIPRDRSIL